MLTSSTKCNKCISEKIWIAKSHFWKLLCRVLGRRHTAKEICTRQHIWFAECLEGHTANVTGSWQPLRFQMFAVCRARSTRQNQAFAVCIILPCVFLPSAQQTCSFVVCPLFAMCYFWDTRQIISLPANYLFAECPHSCSRQTWDTRQISCFP